MSPLSLAPFCLLGLSGAFLRARRCIGGAVDVPLLQEPEEEHESIRGNTEVAQPELSLAHDGSRRRFLSKNVSFSGQASTRPSIVTATSNDPVLTGIC